tara:strand:- start:1646 stop:1822 length:177 start_codon:yes stop_codon:yes gene_type:complete
MPISTRKTGEGRDEFISRCVSEMEVIEQSWTPKQIQAVCYTRLHETLATENDKIPTKL